MNGEKLCRAGIKEDGVLTSIVTGVARAKDSDCFLTVGGLISHAREHVDWVRHQPLKPGDKIEILIADSETASEPRSRTPEDQQSAVEERKKYVRKLAEELGWKVQEG